ncbi:inorganic phosphate transporter [Thiolapillus brandeum]|uniref:Inorganic phosphate transporter PiT family n=1 Tax=Thiolapillus brandeum TaxID=1076588 RepID=A0A7U6JHQ1_9GAMM|nr:inorganic phosphate transporter [Thiolapillus brandeum]BAO44032.1 inorganic phosphate transporter PiT family [Thiolapillus brandeum]
MESLSIALVLVVITVAAYDFTNGFHDAADMVATAIASRAMRPATAITIVSIFTLMAPFTVGLAVADTVGTFIDISDLSHQLGEAIVIAALLAAISYNLITWKLGYPSSSSNSLAGGLTGAGLYAAGTSHINWGWEALQQFQLEGLMKVGAGLLVSPLFGFIIGYLIMKLIFLVFRHFSVRIRPLFIITQYFSVAWLGFSHGANDAQKGMAIIGMMLLASGHTQVFSVPDWAILLCAVSITLGTMFGGWSIIKTLGFGLYRLRTIHAVANQLGSALVNSLATSIGAPTSTTQVVTATLLGNGAAEKPQHVRWGKAAGIVAGWWLNIPVSMLLGATYCFVYLALWSPA